MDRSHYRVKVIRDGDEGEDDYVKSLTPEERIGMMWPLAVQAWAFKGEDVRQQRLQRDVVRIIRGKR